MHTSHNVFDFTMTWLVQLEVTESLEVTVKNILTAFAFFFLCYIVAIHGTSSSLLNETLIMASIKANIPFLPYLAFAYITYLLVSREVLSLEF